MKIVVAGMPQSGSTALFNIITSILKLQNKKYHSFLYGPKAYNQVIDQHVLSRLQTNDVIIIKEHHHDPFLKEWADLLLISKRDIRDSIASRRRRNKALFSKGKRAAGKHQYNPSTLEGFKRWCHYLTDDCYMQWLPANFEFCYEQYVINREATVHTIMTLLAAPELEPRYILGLVDNLSDRQDDKNFYSASKRTAQGKTNNFHQHLSPLELRYIETHYAQWIVNF